MAGKPDPFGCYLNIVEEFTTLGLFLEESKAAIERMIELEPKAAEGYALRARMTLDGGSLEQIRQDALKAATLDPEFAMPHVVLALAHERDKDYAIALTHINDALRLAPDAAAFYEVRGGIHYHLGEKRAAIADYEKTLEVQTDYDAALESLAITHLELGELDAALHYAKQAVAAFPDNDELRALQSEIEKALGDK